MKKVIVLTGIACVAMPQANAAESGNPAIKPVFEDDERIFDGLSFSSLQLDTSLAGFDLELDTSVVREARNMPAAGTVASASSLRDYSAGTRPARLTDLRLSARRSVPLTKKIMVDMLFRAEIPTGNVRAGLGRGRSELMADLGVRAELKPVSLWVGGARRFNKPTRWSTGRDVNEIYAGWNARVNKSTDIRMDFVSTERRSTYLPREWRISAEYGKKLGTGKRVAFYAANDVGPWGKDVNAGLTVQFKF